MCGQGAGRSVNKVEIRPETTRQGAASPKTLLFHNDMLAPAPTAAVAGGFGGLVVVVTTAPPCKWVTCAPRAPSRIIITTVVIHTTTDQEGKKTFTQTFPLFTSEPRIPL